MILLLIGKSASGKDAIMRDFTSTNFVQKIVSYTTRPKRKGEVSGVDYIFITDQQFTDMKNEGRFFQTREYETCVCGRKDIWYYGSGRVQNQRIPYASIVDIQGAKDYIKEYGKENIFCVYVDADDATRENRAKLRGSFDQQEWDRRLKDDSVKFSMDSIKEVADLIVDNSNDIRDAEFEIAYGFYSYIMDRYAKKDRRRVIK